MEHMGERIKIIRKMYNIKQKEFAERVSVSASYISKSRIWQRGSYRYAFKIDCFGF